MQMIDAVSPAARGRLVEEALSAAAALGPAGFPMSARAAAVLLAPDDDAAPTITAPESALAMESGATAAEQERAGTTLRVPFDSGFQRLNADAAAGIGRRLPNGVTGNQPGLLANGGDRQRRRHHRRGPRTGRAAAGAGAGRPPPVRAARQSAPCPSSTSKARFAVQPCFSVFRSGTSDK